MPSRCRWWRMQGPAGQRLAAALAAAPAGLVGVVWVVFPDLVSKIHKDGGLYLYRPAFHGALLEAGLKAKIVWPIGGGLVWLYWLYLL